MDGTAMLQCQMLGAAALIAHGNCSPAALGFEVLSIDHQLFLFTSGGEHSSASCFSSCSTQNQKTCHGEMFIHL